MRRLIVAIAAGLMVSTMALQDVEGADPPYSLGVTPLVAQPAPGAQPAAVEPPPSSFAGRFFRAYIDSFKEQPASDEPEPPRRAMPAPLSSPPLPGAEYQGYPLIGVPYSAP